MPPLKATTAPPESRLPTSKLPIANTPDALTLASRQQGHSEGGLPTFQPALHHGRLEGPPAVQSLHSKLPGIQTLACHGRLSSVGAGHGIRASRQLGVIPPRLYLADPRINPSNNATDSATSNRANPEAGSQRVILRVRVQGHSRKPLPLIQKYEKQGDFQFF